MPGSLLRLVGSLLSGLFRKNELEEWNRHAETMGAARISATVEEAIGRGQGVFGRAVDAYTRLMRPLILTLAIFGAVWIVHLCYSDPLRATAVLEAIAMAEDVLLMLLIFPLAHFGIRPLEKSSIFRRAADVALRRAQASTISALVRDSEVDRRLAAELDDTSRPLSNWAIVEINRRLKEGRPIRPPR